jgi:hypothetical protein
MKLRIVVETVMEVDPSWYENNATPEEMAEVEKANFGEDPMMFLEYALENEHTITITPL